jgi:hypothetical protein
MKAKLNLTIEEDILQKMKKYASRQKTSISEIVEDYFKTISVQKGAKSLVEMIDNLPKPNIDDDINFKEEYYKAKTTKYGL